MHRHLTDNDRQGHRCVGRQAIDIGAGVGIRNKLGLSMQKGENYHAVQRDRLRGWRGVFDGNAFLLESSLPAAVRKGFCCCQVVLP